MFILLQQKKPFLWHWVAYATHAVVLWGCFCGHANAVVKPMGGVTPELSALILRCAPTVHPETMAAIISAESRGHQFAIADAGPKNLPWAQRKQLVRSYYLGTAEEAIAKAEILISSGHTVSLGLSQVNDRNLAALGLTVRDIFDPCTNLAAGGKIMTGFYTRAVQQFGPGPRALRAAISAYNSGDWQRGERDGYVALVFNQRGKPLALKTDPVPSLSFRPSNKALPVGRSFAMSANAFGVVD